MGTYTVEIKETLKKRVKIDAVDEQDAIRYAMMHYKTGEIVLTADDFDGDVIFKVVAGTYDYNKEEE